MTLMECSEGSNNYVRAYVCTCVRVYVCRAPVFTVLLPVRTATQITIKRFKPLMLNTRTLMSEH